MSSGVEWQRIMERRAAEMGGGDLVAPVQRVTDFLAGRVGLEEGEHARIVASSPILMSVHGLQRA